MQAVPITTDVVNLLLIRAMCTQLFDKDVSDLRQVGGFLLVLRFPQTIKLTATMSLKYC